MNLELLKPPHLEGLAEGGQPTQNAIETSPHLMPASQFLEDKNSFYLFKSVSIRFHHLATESFLRTLTQISACGME